MFDIQLRDVPEHFVVAELAPWRENHDQFILVQLRLGAIRRNLNCSLIELFGLISIRLFQERVYLRDLLPKFISKKGRPFSVHLKLENGKVGFEFAEKTPRAKKSAARKVAAAA